MSASTREVKLFAMTHISNSLGHDQSGGGVVRAGARSWA